ncbi:hypothetical protein [Endozoicomonas sp. SESOKO3]|uniref:hypothetical protein n=1 Tax=Endozoicomonas sp. SESOKO3 TaxID=2828744 RepID=UPI0021472565|nr:hypothetical protein [Endozoicomonas sp. SESOKO3]
MKHHYSAPFKSRKSTIRTQGRAINAIAYPKKSEAPDEKHQPAAKQQARRQRML